MLALKIRQDYRRQRLASGASLMPALPPALDTPQHHALLWQRHPARQEGARAAKRAPSWRDLRAVYSQTAVCRAFRMHGAHILPKPARFGCMACESCQEGAIFPSEAPFGIHGVKKLPRIAAWERTAAESCHCQSGQGRIRAQSRHRRTLGNAFRGHFAIGECPGTHQGTILPSPGTQKHTDEELA